MEIVRKSHEHLPSFDYFQEFVEKEEKTYSFYEKLCKMVPIKISCPENIRKAFEQSIWLSDLKVSADEAYSLAIFSLLVTFPIFLLPSLLDLPSSLIFLSFPLLIFFHLLTYPKFYSEVIRIRAANEAASIVLYMVSYLSLNPVYDASIVYAASRCHGPLGNDMKKAVWGVFSGKYTSMKEALSAFSKKWLLWNEEFVNVLTMMQLIEIVPSEERRSEILQASTERLLKGNYRKMENYAENLRTPSLLLLFFGIMLPLMGLIAFPLISIFLAGAIKPFYIAFGYTILLPVILFWFLYRILSKRPGGYSHTEKMEEVQPDKYIKFGNLQLPIVPFAILFGVIIMLPGLLHYAELFSYYYYISTTYSGAKAQQLWREYSLSSYSQEHILIDTFNAMFVIWGLAFIIIFSYFFRSSKPFQFDQYIRKLENDFEYGLFELHSALQQNVPIEIALDKVKKQYERINKTDSPIYSFFAQMYEKLVKEARSLESILFGEKGLLYEIPSSMIRNVMSIITSAISESSTIASYVTKNISYYLGRLSEIEDLIKKTTIEITSNLEMQGKLIAPFMAAIVASSAVIIIQLLQGVAYILKSFQQMQGGVVVGESFSDIFELLKIQEVMPPTLMELIVGIYFIESVLIICYFYVGIARGFNKVHREYLTYKWMLTGIILFSLIFFGVIWAFQPIYNQIAGRLG
jgi:hypothetical protein